jgi:hypothetical protein
MNKRREDMTLQERVQSIHYAIGLAITQWQTVENALTQVFVLLLESPSAGAASAAFASVLNFNSKLAMVDAAAFVVIGKTALFSEWETLRNALSRKAKKRNELAHFMMYQRAIITSTGEEIDLERMNRDIDWYLKPTFFDGAILHRYGGKPPELTTDDIMNRANAFIGAANRVWHFGEKIRALKAPSSEAATPKP